MSQENEKDVVGKLTGEEIRLLIATLERALEPTDEDVRRQEAERIDRNISTIRETEEKLLIVLGAVLPDNNTDSTIIMNTMSEWLRISRMTQVESFRMQRNELVAYTEDEINAFGSDEESTKETLLLEYEIEVKEEEPERFPGNSGREEEKPGFFSIQQDNFPSSEQVLAFVIFCLVAFILYNLR